MTGDQGNMLARIKALVPPWFANSTPLLDAVITAFASAWAFVYGFIAYAKTQTRILTASGIWLDAVAQDFFGTALLRGTNQPDTGLRARILINLFRERATRRGLVSVLTQLTGNVPTVLEPTSPADTGVYGGPGLAYGGVGSYGSMSIPFQAFVIAYRPFGVGIPGVPGYSTPNWGYGLGGEYASIADISGSATDADIYAAIESVRPAATIIWTRITNLTAPQQMNFNSNPLAIDQAPLLIS